MKLIHLLRHAKSSWDDPALGDFERPLNKRGRRAAKSMAKYFRRTAIRPAVVLCSPAKRTQETLELVAPALHGAPTIFDKRLYEASEQTLLTRLRELPADLPGALLLGHNPGLERLALTLIATDGDDPAASRMREKFPSCALAILSAPIDDWRDLSPHSCRLDAFVRPVDLEEDE